MKKLLILFALTLVTMAGWSQTSVWAYPVNNVLLTGDTTFYVPISENYSFDHQFYFRGNTDSVSVVLLHSAASRSKTVAPGDSLFCVYAGMDTVTYTSATATAIYEDVLGSAGTWQGLKVMVTDTCYFYYWYNLRRK